MVQNISALSILVAAVLATATSSPISNLRQDDVPNGLVFIGATSNKELYITTPEVVSKFTSNVVD